MKKTVLISCLVIAIGVWAGVRASSDDVNERQAVLEKYRWEKVERGDVAEFITAMGTVNPVGAVSVGAQLSGTVFRVHVDYNERVRKGQILAELDPAIYLAQLKQSHASLDVSRASLDLAKTTFARNEELLEKGFVSSSAVDLQRKELVSAEAQFELAKAQVDRAQTDYTNTFVRSPIDGVVLKRNVESGQTLAAMFQAPELFQIAQDLTRMQIEANVSEADVANLRPGMNVLYTVDAYRGEQFEGTVRQLRLSPAVKTGSVSYLLIAEIDNSKERLKPGMTTNVRVITRIGKDVLRIPTAAIRFRPTDDIAPGNSSKTAARLNVKPAVSRPDDGTSTDDGFSTKLRRVFVIGADGKLVGIPLQIGISNLQYTEIVKSNLHEGDSVVMQEQPRANN